MTEATETLEAALQCLPLFARRTVDIDAALAEMRMTAETAEPVERPRVYQVETTAKCNLECTFCPRTIDLLGSNKRDLDETMPLEKFEAMLDALPWLESLELFHFGEPFMTKDFHRYVQACTDRGIYSVVASNLLPATPDKLTAAFEAGLGFLVMDVDSLDAEKYASIRVKGNLAKLRERVVDILSRDKRPYTVAQTVMVDGVPEYSEEEFLQWTGGLQADEVRYKFLDSFRGTVTDEKGLLPKEAVCREPFFGFTVHANGNVVPCDRDWAGENVMGNVFEEDPMAIWNGARYKAFREAMKSEDKPAMCRSCPEGELVNLRSAPLVQVNMFNGEEVKHS